MRMLFMADVDSNPNAGAAGTETRTIAALRGIGDEVDEIWAHDLSRRFAHGNLHYLLELPFEYRRAMRQALARKAYDVIRVNQPHGWLAAKWLREHPPASGKRAVFIHRSQGFEPHAEEVLEHWRRVFDVGKRPITRRMMSAAMGRLVGRHGRLIAKYADGHIVSSSLDARYLTERLGVPADRIAVIHTAPLPSLVVMPAPPMTGARLRRVLYVGQFAYFKAPMIVAAAMKSLAADYECTWVCAPQHHAAVRALAGDAVRLLAWTEANALKDIYDAHGVFLFPSFFEGFGNVFIEAMSRGLCVVASDVGGAHDVITNGRDGILVAPGDAIAVADAVRGLDLARAASMSEAAAATAREYTWPRVARETAAFHEHLREAVQ